ncbi:lysophospholipid acyltransferase family protein [Natroniella sulfidigena]|uniref:lysophospholipid acyltransferase family protein n=1 Tax=Natroniella sulfidigena TaxID=723921 RepID=UPI00200B5922|nr:lysophospholipid acyltransferase family protein [Natroniella sulfidigena]
MGDWIGYLSFKIFKAVVKFLPKRVSCWLAKLLGSLAFYLAKRRRELAVKNIKLAFDCSTEEANELTKGVFQDLTVKFVEILGLEKWSEADFEGKIEVEGMEHLEEAYQQEQGVILFTGHFGNWELLGIYLTALGYPMNAIARMYQNPKINKEILQIREERGANVYDKKGRGVKKAFRSLLKKECLLILGDQDAHSKGEFVDFFGRLASTPKGPVVLAQKTGALILPVYLVREELDQYRLLIEPPLKIAKDATAQEQQNKLQQLTSSLEEKIREYPKQWLWLHRRWKTRPEEAD